MENIHNLRKISMKLDASGAVTPVRNTKLYKDSFGFVLLQCYAPVTQTARGKPLCTVHRIVIDESGQHKVFNQEKFNMLYVDTIMLEKRKYLLFECPMPKSFTDTVGELELVFNYIEADENGKVLARLTSSVYRTVVTNGGAEGGDVELEINSQEVAQINANTIAIESLQDAVEDFINLDVTEINGKGNASATITENGRLKLSNLKGEPGINATVQWGVNAASPISTLEWKKA